MNRNKRGFITLAAALALIAAFAAVFYFSGMGPFGGP